MKSSVPLPRRSFHRSTRSLTSSLRWMLRCLRQTPLCEKDDAFIGPTQQSATAEARFFTHIRAMNGDDLVGPAVLKTFPKFLFDLFVCPCVMGAALALLQGSGA